MSENGETKTAEKRRFLKRKEKVNSGSPTICSEAGRLPMLHGPEGEGLVRAEKGGQHHRRGGGEAEITAAFQHDREEGKEATLIYSIAVGIGVGKKTELRLHYLGQEIL